MHSFDYRFLRERSVSMEVMNRVARLEGFCQRTRVLSLNRESILQSMERIALVMSVHDSNAIEGIRTTDDRLVPLIEGSTKPMSHSEAEIKGYSDCLRYIHRNHGSIVLSRDTILEMYGMLMAYSDVEPVFKTRDNVIIDRSLDGKVLCVHETVPHQDVEEAIRDMLVSYWEARNDITINNLILIPCFIVDFLRIHPFMDGNGRMSRLLTTLLLYQEGYDVCRYVSLESKINSDLDSYYRALEGSEVGWFENESTYDPFIEYFLGILFLSYREYDRRMAAVIGRRGKSDAVRDVVLNVNIPVSKRDIMEMLPDVSESTVASELKRMLDAGEIVKRGSTRAARYIPTNRG